MWFLEFEMIKKKPKASFFVGVAFLLFQLLVKIKQLHMTSLCTVM